MTNTPESDTMKTLTEFAKDNGAGVHTNHIIITEAQLLATFNAWSAQQEAISPAIAEYMTPSSTHNQDMSIKIKNANIYIKKLEGALRLYLNSNEIYEYVTADDYCKTALASKPTGLE